MALKAAQSSSPVKESARESAREKILNSALSLFSEMGFDGATTRKIADAADVNHALIKYHFGSKELLWRASVDLLFERLDDAMVSFNRLQAQTQDPVERFRLFVRDYVRYCAEHPEHARIMSQESTGENPRLRWAVDQHLRSTRDVLDDLFNGLFEVGALPVMSLISLRYMLTAACQNVFTLATEIQHLYGVNATHDAQIEAHVDAVLKLFLRQSN